MKTFALLATLTLSLAACGGGASKDDVCGDCTDEVKTGCEASWDICDALPAEGDTCKDNLQTSYDTTCK